MSARTAKRISDGCLRGAVFAKAKAGVGVHAILSLIDRFHSPKVYQAHGRVGPAVVDDIPHRERSAFLEALAKLTRLHQ